MKRVLIANRGEIAIRLARAARELGIEPLGIASVADRHALHRRVMTESLIIGAAPARDSYLAIEKIIDAARTMRADAIHPGYGFLSERSDFAEAVLAAGMCFIGPSPQTLAAAGDKRIARQLAHEKGIPTLQGYDGADQRPEILALEAGKIGYPVLIKASNGGGGRGQRVVSTAGDFQAALAAAQREAAAAFGDDSVLLERYVQAPRHIEFQIAADNYGHIVQLGERDCSLQRRRQKVLEEAPAGSLPSDIRAAMGDAAIALARRTDYCNLGTVEFLLEASGAFYFLEINARLQVEHPVTEIITGVDLAQLQFRIARGEALPADLGKAPIAQWAVEARICAEDPRHDLLPAGGTITTWEPPQGPNIRLDSGYAAGSTVPLEYDSLLAKLIVRAPDRDTAFARLHEALLDFSITGVATNIPLLVALTADPDVLAGRVTTSMIDEGGLLRGLVAPGAVNLPLPELALLLCAQVAAGEGFRLADTGGYLLFAVAGQVLRYRVTRDGQAWCFTPTDLPAGAGVAAASSGPAVTAEFDIDQPFGSQAHINVRVLGAKSAAADYLAVAECSALITRGKSGLVLTIDGSNTTLIVEPQAAPSAAEAAARKSHSADTIETVITAPMPGRVARILVNVDESVADRGLLAILEAMKMEHRIEAAAAGRVSRVFVSEGAVVAAGAPLLEILPLTTEAKRS